MKHLYYKLVPLEKFEGPDSKGAGIRWLINAKDGAENYAMRMIEVAPEGHSPHHSHDYEHEAFVWRGNGVVRIADEQYPLAPGTVVFIPPGIKHQFVNTSDVALEFICVIPLSQ